ncbi:hypothetical protein DERP_005787 [Dermatophagoides pteronyssinus]|uniref:Uncharacterized protein n=1 Tax=Dermatophagoides pteronyssinus TaxID=6956 RepID=A0ABQ8JA12_DERPT|nr:hypothetical protein DERP_005787 [Dermatophagoides pteronyssinus]
MFEKKRKKQKEIGEQKSFWLLNNVNVNQKNTSSSPSFLDITNGIRSKFTTTNGHVPCEFELFQFFRIIINNDSHI